MIKGRLNARLGCWDNGEIIIVSVNFGNIEYFVRNGRWDEAAAYLSEKVDGLERAGAELVICVSNTVHRVVEPIMGRRSTPFISVPSAGTLPIAAPWNLARMGAAASPAT